MSWIRGYACTVCSHGYHTAPGDSEHGVPAGTPFVDLPEDWRCPWCESDKSHFVPEDRLQAQASKGRA